MSVDASGTEWCQYCAKHLDDLLSDAVLTCLLCVVEGHLISDEIDYDAVESELAMEV